MDPSRRTEAKRRSPIAGTSAVPALTLDDKTIAVLLAERARFHRFIAARIGDRTAADDILQQSLLRALRHGGDLRCGESVVAWFYRILRNAIADHYRGQRSERVRMERFANDRTAAGDDTVAPPPDWDTAVCTCFRGLLPALRPRDADLLRRIDLGGEAKAIVAGEMKMKRATLDVALHRARAALRERLEIFCGSCSRQSCLACACDQRGRRAQKV